MLDIAAGLDSISHNVVPFAAHTTKRECHTASAYHRRNTGLRPRLQHHVAWLSQHRFLALSELSVAISGNTPDTDRASAERVAKLTSPVCLRQRNELLIVCIWKLHAARFPILARLAKTVLGGRDKVPEEESFAYRFSAKYHNR